MSFLREGTVAFLSSSLVLLSVLSHACFQLFPGYLDTVFVPQLCQAHSCPWANTSVVSSTWKAAISDLPLDDPFS